MWSSGVASSTVLAQSASRDEDTGSSTTHLADRALGRTKSSPEWHEEDLRLIAAIYARYSSDNQSETSVEDQIRLARDRAEREGLRVPPECIYSDHAVSGTLLRRDGLDRLIQDAKRGRFQVLIFYNLGRLARESIIGMPILKTLVEEYGIRFISIAQSIDSNNPNWVMLATIYFLEHENYIKELSGNVHRGQEGTLLNQHSVGDYRFGYSSVPSPSGEMRGRGRNAKPRMDYVIDPDEARWVKQIFEWYVLERRTIKWITKQLNDRNAPKDHRATTPLWQPGQVAGVLSSPKYVGIWPWGDRKNKRLPSTGKVIQIKRSASETEKWVRLRPDLRIVSDELFQAAQELRQKFVEQVKNQRRPDGRFANQPATRNYQHLLAGLLQCKSCGKVFHTTGARAQYMGCSGNKCQICSCTTWVARKLAERLILETIGGEIESNQDWLRLIIELTQDEVEAAARKQPVVLEELTRKLQQLDQKIERLIDQAELSNDPGISARLTQRRKERDDLQRQLREQGNLTRQLPELPTDDWIRQQLHGLHEHFRSGTPAATMALHNLIAGPIILEEVRHDGRRPFLRGILRLRVGPLLINRAMQLPELKGDEPESALPLREIQIDFRKRSKTEEQVEIAWRMLAEKVPIKDIAAVLKVSRARMTAILKQAYAAHGVPIVDGRQRRSTLPESSRAATLADPKSEEVMQLYQQNMPLGEIATRLAIDRNTVTAIILKWHHQRGLTPEDGRSRRKSLETKSNVPQPNLESLRPDDRDADG